MQNVGDYYEFRQSFKCIQKKKIAHTTGKLINGTNVLNYRIIQFMY